MIQDDEKYKTLRDTLRTLPRVKAKADFEARLMQRIKESSNPVVHVTQKIKSASPAKSWLQNLFRPAFVPALGLTVVLLVTVVVYFAYFSKMNSSDKNAQQFVTSTNQGDLIIYVKKDNEDISGNYPKEYSAVNPDEQKSSEFYGGLSEERPSDYFAKPDPTRTVSPDNKPDRVSEEQKIEMQRSLDRDMDKGVEMKGERKSDDMIMKKESKGYIKSDKKDIESKLSDEKKNIYIEDNNEVKQEVKKKESPPPPVKKENTKANEKVESQQEEEKVTGNNRISRATKKDSTKNKSDSEADEKNTEQK